MDNTTFETADRATHLKIVVVSLIASIAVLVVGISARSVSTDVASARIEAGAPLKAGQPVTMSRSETSAVR